MLLNLFEPRADVQEGFLVAKVEDDDDSICSLVVSIRDRSVAFLPGRVPNLQLDRALVDLKGAETEVDTDGRQIVLREAIICETHKQARLTHTGVTNEHELKKVVAIFKISG